MNRSRKSTESRIRSDSNVLIRSRSGDIILDTSMGTSSSINTSMGSNSKVKFKVLVSTDAKVKYLVDKFMNDAGGNTSRAIGLAQDYVGRQTDSARRILAQSAVGRLRNMLKGK